MAGTGMGMGMWVVMGIVMGEGEGLGGQDLGPGMIPKVLEPKYSGMGTKAAREASLNDKTIDSERLRVQITVPEKLRSVTSEGLETEVSYKIAIEGTTYIVNLTQKTFLPHNFEVYGYDEAGIMKPLDEEVQNFCYYRGDIEGYANSLVIITTCTGLRGLLQFENVSYAIEPLESSVGFEHVLYQVKQENKDVSLYASKNTSFNMTYKIKSVKPSAEFYQYIEMHLIIEKDLYKYMGSDTAVVTQKIFQMVGLMNAFFSSFNLTVILASLELWTDENKIPTTGDVNELLHKFQDWKKSYLILRPHDTAFLLVYREAPSHIGAVFQGMVCDKDYGGGIALHPRSMSLDSFAVILVQLLSLSMGVPYDDPNQCHCPGAVCIMNPEAIHAGGVKIFSNCSMEDFAHFMSKQLSQCLQNQPQLQMAYQSSTCGNGKVDRGEACDCGTVEECDKKPPLCCDPTTCQLKATSKCSAGDCCENCEFKSKGAVCRASRDECDLPDLCNGSSPTCGEDLFILNGHPCEDSKWICMNGRCLTGKGQCQEAFGEGVNFGASDCYEQLNSRNDISGNCGISRDGSYTPCAPSNRKCGKLICTYFKGEINRNKFATTIYANISGYICVALEYPLNHKDSNKMWVKDGTVCDTKKVCRNKECVADSYLGYDCTPATCNRNGVCNNKKVCHCNPGFLPPDCNTRASPLVGARFEPERHYIEGAYPTKLKKWPFFLIIPFFIIFSVLIAIVVKVYFQRKKWRTEDYISDEDLQSESEHKDSKEKSG
ncbi:disintegrin and metalloproteinase domain-containing protein 2 [Fukomys damarensis]|uniref:disintegrin and metalloproteinase domain-containing protein 2 n=1 Tax=Fukomys damarensis TaxID=885580 RepID=UPI00053F8453|nr:disintegrin and metalloproteinase domain-containing protein 2 [Fukomys damarensis]